MRRLLARGRRATNTLVLSLLLALTTPLGAGASGAPDAGSASTSFFELDLDLANNRLRVREVWRESSLESSTSQEWADEFRVAVGSPAHPTPRGTFALGRVILRPAWTPGATAAAAGAQRADASLDSPMGVAKIPFAEGGEIALHGGGDPDVLGKPVSSGCVRASDADLLRLIVWLHLRGALSATLEMPNGELVRDFQRPARLRIH